jgi:UDP-glucose 4-epimerase
MNVFITGGAGFIGSHLAERCVAEGWRVSILDDLSSGAFENITRLTTNPRFSYRIDSVLNEPVVAEMVDGADVVFHLAAVVGVKRVMEDPVGTIRINTAGTDVVLGCAARKSKLVMLASTSEVYGKSDHVPFREDDDETIGPTLVDRWCYAASKMLDEFQCTAYRRQQGLPVTVLRFFNTVGPRQTGRYGMVLPTFVGQALRGEPLTVNGSGEQRRCFTYVGDLVEALVRIVETPEAVGETINIGNDEEISINELAVMVKELTASPSSIVHQTYDQAYGPGFEDMQRRVPCLEKLERLIHYRPETSLDQIVRRVIDHEWSRMPKRAMAAGV